MTIAEARSIVKDSTKSPGGDTTEYSDQRIDRAIQTVGRRFVRVTRITKTKSTLTLTIDSNSLPSFPTNFRPEYAFRARLSGNSQSRAMRLIDYDSLLDMRQANAARGIPTHVAFDTLTTGEVWPTPDFAYSVLTWWNEPFTSWTAGGTPSPNSFNIPDEWMSELLAWGASSLVQFKSPEAVLASPGWQEYLKVEAAAAGSGNLGIQSYEAQPDPDGAIIMASEDRGWVIDANGNPVG